MAMIKSGMATSMIEEILIGGRMIKIEVTIKGKVIMTGHLTIVEMTIRVILDEPEETVRQNGRNGTVCERKMNSAA